MWAYAIGKPKEQVEVSANVTMNERLAAERELLRQNLDLAELKALAAESHVWWTARIAAAQARLGTGDIIHVAARRRSAILHHVENILDEAE